VNRPPPNDLGPVEWELFDAIVADAASRAGVDRSAFTVATAAAVTWSDSSLGCPEPGMVYMQALVPGYHVILEQAGTQYDYHADRRGNFRLCPPDRAKEPVQEGGAEL
jgi:hypothetical protein